ncbi:MAG: DUF4065 domain-containing protein [bacterium]|nr:DUF4065 domain-containing protein [bacterium]
MLTQKLLKSLREKKGLSQEYMARELKMSRPSYVLVENGQKEPTLSQAKMLAELLDITLESLIEGKPVSVAEVRFEKGKNAGKKRQKQEERIAIPQEHLEKFRQVLLYILAKVGGKPNIGQTVLYKLLYFIDFDYYEKFEEQLIGARYMKNTHGPTPVAFAKIISELEEQGKVEAIQSKFYKYDQTKYLVNPNNPVNLSGLSGQEIAHIDWELNRLSDLTATQISALSHKDTPWLVAKERGQLDYEHVFYRPTETSVREYEPL